MNRLFAVQLTASFSSGNMADINKLIDKNRRNFAIWEEQLVDNLRLQYDPQSIVSQSEYDRIFFQTNEMLSNIAANFFTVGKFRDNWDTSLCSVFPYGQYLILRSEKMGIEFHWGVDRDCFYLETHLEHAENIRHMTDGFWLTLLKLRDTGEFELLGGGGLDSSQRPYFENKTSFVFQLIRTFMINQTEAMNGGNCSWEYPRLVIKWKMDNDWERLILCASDAFNLVYKLNYQLWKAKQSNQTTKD